ncbi:MAG: bacteriohemerythrin [Minisyncoccales bacterium]
MPIITWTKTHNVGNKIIDTQHKKFVDLINEIYDKLLKKEKIVDSDIINLIEFANEHFKTEEEIFKDYPKADEHKKEHQKIKDDLKKYIDNLDHQKVYGLIGFLARWFNKHLSKMDRTYIDYI